MKKNLLYSGRKIYCSHQNPKALHEKYKVKRAKMLSTHTLKMREDKIHDLCYQFTRLLFSK